MNQNLYNYSIDVNGEIKQVHDAGLITTPSMVMETIKVEAEKPKEQCEASGGRSSLENVGIVLGAVLVLEVCYKFLKKHY